MVTAFIVTDGVASLLDRPCSIWDLRPFSWVFPSPRGGPTNKVVCGIAGLVWPLKKDPGSSPGPQTLGPFGDFRAEEIWWHFGKVRVLAVSPWVPGTC